VIGNRSDLPDDVNVMLDNAITETSANTGMVLTLALSYGGRQEICRAAAVMAQEVAAGRLSADEITVDKFSSYLDTCDIPDPDLLIRTSGEMVSATFYFGSQPILELYFTNQLPDFTINELKKALLDTSPRKAFRS
jgi:undecaprenyl diphosphate synthase